MAFLQNLMRILPGGNRIGANRDISSRPVNFEPTEQERSLIDVFGRNKVSFMEVREELNKAGLPVERIDAVWEQIRRQRMEGWEPGGKERSGVDK